MKTLQHSRARLKRENLVLERIPEFAGVVPQKGNTKARFLYECETMPIEIPIGIHYLNNGKVMIHVPGYDERMDGYKDKYKTLAEFVQRKGLATVLRIDCLGRLHHQLENTLPDDLRAILNYSIKDSRQICGSDNPEIYLMGFSLGTSVVSEVAYEFPQVKRVLLMGTGGLDSKSVEGISRFSGEIYLVTGENDRHICDARTIYGAAVEASNRELVVIPNCDHHFRHETNDKIYSKAPFWAFGGDTSFPNPEGGIRLVQK